MTEILAAWELGLRYGHVALLNAVAAPLAGAGHRVTLAAKDLVTVAAMPGAHFTRVVQAPLFLGRPPLRRATVTYGQVIADGGFADPAAIETLVRGWLTLFELAVPDLLVAEHAPAALLAAHVAGLTSVRMGTPFTVPPAVAPMPRLVSEALVPAQAGEEPDREIDAVIEAVLRRFGRPSVGGIAGLLSRSRAFLASWPELDFAGVRAGHAYYGPLVGFGGAARPDWPGGNGPRVFIYLPFRHSAAAELITILGGHGWPTLWHSQDRPDRDLPPTIRYAAEPLDVEAVLPEAAVVVGRAGHGLSAAALRHGVPGLLFPDTLESGLVAGCMVRAALAVMPRRPTADAIAAGLDQLMRDERIAAACMRARGRYQGYNAKAAAKRMAADMLTAQGRKADAAA